MWDLLIETWDKSMSHIIGETDSWGGKIEA